MEVDLIVKSASELHTMQASRDSGEPKTGEEMKDTGRILGGALAVKDGVITAVGETADIMDKYDAETVVDAAQKTVIPGFVDPHTHLVFAGSREDELVMKIEGKTYMEILEEGGGIQRTVERTREASKAELDIFSRERLDNMLRYGTTTAEVKSGYGLDLENEVKMLEVMQRLNEDHPVDLVPTYLGAHSLSPEFDDSSNYIDYCREKVLPEVAERELAEYCDIFCEEGVFEAEESRKLLEEAQELGMEAKVHADEIENIGCSTMAGEIGAVSAEHLVTTSEEDIKKMIDSGTIGVLLPGTPFMLMEDEYSPARKMMDMGLPVAIATDLNPNCWTESMQMIITLACLQMKMIPSEALNAATYNAARAVGRTDIGSLEEGKRADFLILDVPTHQHIPYHFGVNLVEEVYKDGEWVVDNRTR